MAVISIVFFYPRLTQLLDPGNPLLKYTWQLLCISLAAQMGTFPLSIYYFNQFPVYFWLSNFVVVPAGYLILGMTVVFFACFPFEIIQVFIAQVLCCVSDTTLFLLKKTGQLPFAVIGGLSISPVQFGCLFLMLGFLMLFIVYKKHPFFFTAILLLLLFQAEGFMQKVNLFNQQKLIVYQSKERLIHLVNGRRNYLITESENPPDPFLFKNVLLKLKLAEPSIIRIQSSTDFSSGELIIRQSVMQFSGKSLLTGQKAQGRISRDQFLIFSSGLLDLKQTGRDIIYLQADKEKND
jgi:competence protein ComEC